MIDRFFQESVPYGTVAMQFIRHGLEGTEPK